MVYGTLVVVKDAKFTTNVVWLVTETTVKLATTGLESTTDTTSPADTPSVWKVAVLSIKFVLPPPIAVVTPDEVIELYIKSLFNK